jgi:hypothetical protein
MRGQQVCPLCDKGTFALPGSGGAGRDGELAARLPALGWRRMEGKLRTSCCSDPSPAVRAGCCELSLVFRTTLGAGETARMPPTAGNRTVLALVVVGAEPAGEVAGLPLRANFSLAPGATLQSGCWPAPCTAQSPLPYGCHPTDVQCHPTVRVWGGESYTFTAIPLAMQRGRYYQPAARPVPARTELRVTARAAATEVFVALASGCEVCPAGSYSAVRGAWICSACTPGRAAPIAGAAKCTLCQAGKYTPPPPPPPPSPCAKLVLEQDDECQFIVTTSFRLGIGCDSDLAAMDTGSGNFAGHTLAEFCPGSCGACLGWAGGGGGGLQQLGPTECTTCAVGTFGLQSGASSASVCRPCPRGNVDHDHDPTTPCAPCAAGRYANQSEGACRVCAPGLADLDRDPHTPCQRCVAGRYSGAARTVCVGCAAGRQDHDRDPATACTRCAEGEHGPGEAAPCARCPAGRRDDDGAPATTCLQCNVGSYSTGGTAPCATCPPGAADSDLDPGTPCASCERGFYLAPQATLCTACAAGRIDADADTTTPCVDACGGGGGGYAPPASTACEPCAAGRHDPDRSAATPCVSCRRGTCAGRGQVRCGACAGRVVGSLRAAGPLGVGDLHAALVDVVGADGPAAVRLTSVTQTAGRALIVRGHPAADFAPADGGSVGGAGGATIKPSAGARFWREALELGVAAAVRERGQAQMEAAAAARTLAAQARGLPPTGGAAPLRASVSVELHGVSPAPGPAAPPQGRRRLSINSAAQPGARVEYTVSVTTPDVLSRDAPHALDLLSLFEAVDASSSSGSSGSTVAAVPAGGGGGVNASVAYAEAVRAGVNAALRSDAIADAAFLAKVPLLPLGNGSVGVGRGGAAGTAPLLSEVNYELTSTEADAPVRARLGAAALSQALRAAAAANGRAASAVSVTALLVQPAPAPPPAPPSDDGMSVGPILVLVLVLGLGAWLGYREHRRRRRIGAHRAYVAEEKAKEEARQAAETDEQRGAREAAEREAIAEAERRAMAHAVATAEAEGKRALRAKNLKGYEAAEVRRSFWGAVAWPRLAGRASGLARTATHSLAGMLGGLSCAAGEEVGGGQGEGAAAEGGGARARARGASCGGAAHAEPARHAARPR